MSRWVLALIATALPGCRTLLGFEDVETATIDAPPGSIDVAPDVTIGPVVDGQMCFGTFTQFCPSVLPTTDIALTTATAINTDASIECSSEFANQCVVVARSITIFPSAIVTLTGSRPLVLLGTTSIVVDGTLDGSSTTTRTGPGALTNPSCLSAVMPSGGGGGGGGSFGGRGGPGGRGLAGMAGASALTSPITTYQAGCRGQSGAGPTGGAAGLPGGALGLVSPAISISGRINVSGSGGRGAMPMDNGGGGGGSGGLLVLDTPSLDLRPTTLLLANGGGGGEGAGTSGGGSNGAEPSVGNPTVRAPGGAGGTGGGGDGGAGSAGAVLDGVAGADGSSGGGGGGGGGAGKILTTDPTPLAVGISSPPLT